MQPQKITRRKLSSAEVETLVNEALARLLKVCKPLQVYLFGSLAEGRATDQSDLDLMIIMKDDRKIREAQIALRPFLPLSPTGADLVWMTEQEFQRKKSIGGLCMVVAEDGKLLFEDRHD